jgi:hypothetical protein
VKRLDNKFEASNLIPPNFVINENTNKLQGQNFWGDFVMNPRT